MVNEIYSIPAPLNALTAFNTPKYTSVRYFCILKGKKVLSGFQIFFFTIILSKLHVIVNATITRVSLHTRLKLIFRDKLGLGLLLG